MLTNKPQPQILTIWRVALALIALAPALLTSLLLRIGSTAWLAVTATWILLFLAAYLVYLPLRYKRLAFGISGEKVLLVGGVLRNRVIAMPLANIQFTTVTQTLLSRLFGLAALVVTAPGGRMVIPGLKLSDARALAASLGEVP